MPVEDLRDDGRIRRFSSTEDSVHAAEIEDVERADSIMSFAGLQQNVITVN